MRYELTDFEWAAIRSFLPNKPRGNLIRTVLQQDQAMPCVATRYDKLAANYLAQLAQLGAEFGYFTGFCVA
jgi:hypothetical protein